MIKNTLIKVAILADMYYNYKYEQTNTKNVKDTHFRGCLLARINLAISILYYYKVFIMSRRKMAYCDFCGKEVKTRVITKKETFYVREDAIEINAKVMVCAECGEEMFNEKLDTETFNSVYGELPTT